MKKKIKDVVSGYYVNIHAEKLRGRTVYVIVSPTLGVADQGWTVEEAKKSMEEAIKCHTTITHPLEQPAPEPDIKSGIQEVQVSDESIRLGHHA